MRLIILAMAFLAFSANANITANTAGKTLDQFFVMASEVFAKAVIVDPQINGTLKVYGVSNGNFERVFYSILRVHNLGYVESDDVIRIFAQNEQTKHNAVTSRQSLFDFIAATVSDVYISGSMSYHSNKSRPRYEYAFVQGESRNVFDPSNIGLRVIGVTPCLAQLSFDTYKTFVTCEPYRQSLKPIEEDDTSIRSIFNERPEREPTPEKEQLNESKQ